MGQAGCHVSGTISVPEACLICVLSYPASAQYLSPKEAQMTPIEMKSRIIALEQKVADLQSELENDRIAARIRQGLEAADAGRTTSAREALEQLRQKHNIPRL